MRKSLPEGTPSMQSIYLHMNYTLEQNKALIVVSGYARLHVLICT